MAVVNSTVAGNSPAGIVNYGGTVTVTNSIVAGNGANNVEDDCDNCGVQSVQNLIGLPNGLTNINQILGSLALSPATAGVPVMMPLPGATSIQCQGAAANLPAGVTNDEREFPMDPQCSAGAIDLGAAQTNYQNVRTTGFMGVANQAITPAPTAEVFELNMLTGNENGVGGIPITLSLAADNQSGPSWLSGVLTQTTAPAQTVNGIDNLAIYPGLAISEAGSYDFPPSSTASFGNLTENMVTFSIDAATTAQLAFGANPPPSQIVAGGNAGIVTVQEESQHGLPLTSASDSIQLQVTGQNNYSQTYTVSAEGGVATFDLSAVPLTVSGTYFYTASLAANSAVNTQDTEFVMALSVPASVTLTSYPSPEFVGVSAPAMISMLDQYGNLVSGYSGTVMVTTTDPAATSNGATIPQAGVPVAFNGGVDMTVISVAFSTVGTQVITASAGGMASGSQTGIVIVSPPSFVVNTNQDAGVGATDCPANSASNGPGVCTLRDALAAAANAGAGNITFDSTVFAPTNSAAANTIQVSTTTGYLLIPSYTSITGPTSNNNGVLTNLVTIDGGWDGVAGDSVGTTVFAVGLNVTNAALNNLNIQHANGWLGGGITNEGVLTVTNSTFSVNDATAGGNGPPGAGGAIFNSDALTLTGCAFSGNSATAGTGLSSVGGAILNFGTLTLTNGTFINNSSAGSSHGSGGAISNAGGTAAITGSVFSRNSAIGSSGNASGGALGNSGDGTMTVTNSTFFGNSASGARGTRGGAIANHGGGTLAVADSTISGNWANKYGGGIYIENGSTLTLANTIVSGNWLGTTSTPGSYDDLDDQTGSSTFSGGPSDSGGNVLGYYNAAFLTPQPTQPPAAAAILAPLGYYGGPTQTMIPLPGSAAICGGLQNSIPPGVTTDQRGAGYPNINSTYQGYSAGTPCVDAGAVQTNYALSFSTEPSDTSANTNFAAAVTLTESGNAFQPAVTIPLTLTGAGTLTGGSASTVSGIADYTLQVDTAGSGDTLAANLALNPSATPQPAIAATSSSFSVGGASGTTVTLSLSANMVTYTTPVTFTATLPSAATGTVTFLNNGTATLGTGMLIGGVATFTTSELSAGTYTVTASYPGDSSYSAATSSQQTLTVRKREEATLAVTGMPTTAEPYNATFTVSTSGGSGTGAITFAATGVCSANLTSGLVTITSGTGTCSVTATKAAETDYISTTSAPVTVSAEQAAATVTLGSLSQTYTGSALAVTATTTPSGLSVTFTYNGSSTAPTAAGSYTVVGTINDANYTGSSSNTLVIAKAAATVTLGSLSQTYTGSALAATATTVPKNLAVIISYSQNNSPVAAPVNAGSYAVTATINNPDYGGSASGTLVVVTAAAAVSVTSSANPAVFSNPVTLTATVSSSAGTPTGQVLFLDGTTPLGSAALSSGAATFTISSLTAGVHSITAVYAANVGFAGASSSVLSLAVADFSVGNTGGSGGSTGQSQTASPGGSATYTIALVPSAGTTFPSAMTLTVTGLPSGATATLSTPGWTQQSSTSWTLPANQPVSNVTVTLQLPTQTAAVGPNNGPVTKLPFVALGILLLPFARKWRTAGKRMNRWLCIALIATGMAAMAGVTGCGGSPSKSQTYNVTLTVTAGALSHSTQLTLTVE